VSVDKTFRVAGMHCPACEFLVADEVSGEPGLESARAALVDGRLYITLQDDADAGDLKRRWNQRLDPLGYRLFLESEDPARVTRGETLQGLGLGAAFLAVFGLLQVSGVVNLLAPETLGIPGSFVLGLLASVSSCFALVGGLLVSYTAAVGRRNPRVLGPGLLAFHLSRLGVFVVGGGVLGAAGAALGLTADVEKVLLTLAAVVMAALGLSLLGLRFGARTMSTGPLGKARVWASWGTVGGGALLGASTFLLPCGFTQSVQFQALASGSFVDGALLTGAFALGTLPVLAGLGWFLGKGLNGTRRAVLLKAGGTLVLGLGLVQLWGAFHLWGLRF